MIDHPSRRRLLALSAAGLSSLAGCSTTEITGPEHGPNTPPGGGGPRNTHDGSSNQPPETPAATIHNHSGSNTFTLFDLPRYDGWPDMSHDDWFSYLHPDTRVFHVEVGTDAIAVTCPSLKLNRDIELAAHYETSTGEVKTVEKTVTPESDDFQEYQWAFVAQEPRPTLTRARVEITARDTHAGDDAERSLVSHQYMAFPYEDASGRRTHFVNDKKINYNQYDKQDGTSNTIRPRQHYSEYVETSDDRTRFFVAYAFDPQVHGEYHGELFGGHTTVSKQDYHEWESNKHRQPYRERHFPTPYMYHSEQFNFFTTLARTYGASLDNAGVTDHFMRLEMLNLLLGPMPYEGERDDDPQHVNLYEGVGDCTEFTFLYLSLMKLPEFGGSRGAFILCDLGTFGLHAVVGIDERDLGNPPNPGEIKFITPSQERINQGIPDTRYAFVELTSSSPIGEYTQIKEMIGVEDTTELTRSPSLREF